jgi:hypothetical protein
MPSVRAFLPVAFFDSRLLRMYDHARRLPSLPAGRRSTGGG